MAEFRTNLTRALIAEQDILYARDVNDQSADYNDITSSLQNRPIPGTEATGLREGDFYRDSTITIVVQRRSGSLRWVTAVSEGAGGAVSQSDLITGGSVSGTSLILVRGIGNIVIPGLPQGGGGGGGLTPEQAAAIAANTAKVGITPQQAQAIIANSAKIGITPEQSAAIALNTAKVGITQAQADAIVANSAKIGLTQAQITAINNINSTIDSRVKLFARTGETGPDFNDLAQSLQDRINAGGTTGINIDDIPPVIDYLSPDNFSVTYTTPTEQTFQPSSDFSVHGVLATWANVGKFRLYAHQGVANITGQLYSITAIAGSSLFAQVSAQFVHPDGTTTTEAGSVDCVINADNPNVWDFDLTLNTTDAAPEGSTLTLTLLGRKDGGVSAESVVYVRPAGSNDLDQTDSSRVIDLTGLGAERRELAAQLATIPRWSANRLVDEDGNFINGGSITFTETYDNDAEGRPTSEGGDGSNITPLMRTIPGLDDARRLSFSYNTSNANRKTATYASLTTTPEADVFSRYETSDKEIGFTLPGENVIRFDRATAGIQIESITLYEGGIDPVAPAQPDPAPLPANLTAFAENLNVTGVIVRGAAFGDNVIGTRMVADNAITEPKLSAAVRTKLNRVPDMGSSHTVSTGLQAKGPFREDIDGQGFTIHTAGSVHIDYTADGSGGLGELVYYTPQVQSAHTDNFTPSAVRVTYLATGDDGNQITRATGILLSQHATMAWAVVWRQNDHIDHVIPLPNLQRMNNGDIRGFALDDNNGSSDIRVYRLEADHHAGTTRTGRQGDFNVTLSDDSPHFRRFVKVIWTEDVSILALQGEPGDDGIDGVSPVFLPQSQAQIDAGTVGVRQATSDDDRTLTTRTLTLPRGPQGTPGRDAATLPATDINVATGWIRSTLVTNIPGQNAQLVAESTNNGITYPAHLIRANTNLSRANVFIDVDPDAVEIACLVGDNTTEAPTWINFGRIDNYPNGTKFRHGVRSAHNDDIFANLERLENGRWRVGLAESDVGGAGNRLYGVFHREENLSSAIRGFNGGSITSVSYEAIPHELVIVRRPEQTAGNLSPAEVTLRIPLPSSTSGLTQADVDARITALVHTIDGANYAGNVLTISRDGAADITVQIPRAVAWAQEGNTDQIPANKLGNAPGSTDAEIDARADARIAAGVADYARGVTGATIPDIRIPSTIARDSEIPTNAEIDARADARVVAGVADWAEDGNTDQIPANKLNNAPSGGGGGNAATWAQTGNTDAIPRAKVENAYETRTVPVSEFTAEALNNHDKGLLENSGLTLAPVLGLPVFGSYIVQAIESSNGEDRIQIATQYNGFAVGSMYIRTKTFGEWTNDDTFVAQALSNPDFDLTPQTNGTLNSRPTSRSFINVPTTIGLGLPTRTGNSTALITTFSATGPAFQSIYFTTGDLAGREFRRYRNSGTEFSTDFAEFGAGGGSATPIIATDHYLHIGTPDLDGDATGVVSGADTFTVAQENTKLPIRFDDSIAGYNLPTGGSYDNATGAIVLPAGHWIVCASTNIVSNPTQTRGSNSRIIAYLGIEYGPTGSEVERHAQSVYLRNNPSLFTSGIDDIQGKVSVTGAVITDGTQPLNISLRFDSQASNYLPRIRGAHIHAYQQLVGGSGGSSGGGRGDGLNQEQVDARIAAQTKLFAQDGERLITADDTDTTIGRATDDIASGSVSGTTLTLTKNDDTTIEITGLPSGGGNTGTPATLSFERTLVGERDSTFNPGNANAGSYNVIELDHDISDLPYDFYEIVWETTGSFAHKIVSAGVINDLPEHTNASLYNPASDVGIGFLAELDSNTTRHYIFRTADNEISVTNGARPVSAIRIFGLRNTVSGGGGGGGGGGGVDLSQIKSYAVVGNADIALTDLDTDLQTSINSFQDQGEVDARVIANVKEYALTSNRQITDTDIDATIGRASADITGGSVSGTTLTLIRASGNITITGLPSGGGTGGGQTQAQVDARIASQTKTFAQTGQAGPGLTDLAPALQGVINANTAKDVPTDAEIRTQARTVVEPFAQAGNSAQIPNSKIPDSIARDTEIPTNAEIQAQARTVVQAFAQAGDSSEVPDNKIPATITRDSEVKEYAIVGNRAIARTDLDTALQTAIDNAGTGGEVDTLVSAQEINDAETGEYHVSYIPASPLDLVTGMPRLSNGSVSGTLRVINSATFKFQEYVTSNLVSNSDFHQPIYRQTTGNFTRTTAFQEYTVDETEITRLIDRRVPTVFRTGNEDRIPLDKLPHSLIGSAGLTWGVNRLQTPVAEGVQTAVVDLSNDDGGQILATFRNPQNHFHTVVIQNINDVTTVSTGVEFIEGAFQLRAWRVGGNDQFRFRFNAVDITDYTLLRIQRSRATDGTQPLDWASVGNTDTIPDNKISSDITRDSEVEPWAQTANTNTQIPVSKIPGDVARDSEIASFARASNPNTQVPDSKIPAAITRDSEIENFAKVENPNTQISADKIPGSIARSNNLITGGSVSGTTLTLNRSSGDISIPGLPQGGGGGSDNVAEWAQTDNTDFVPESKMQRGLDQAYAVRVDGLRTLNLTTGSSARVGNILNYGLPSAISPQGVAWHRNRLWMVDETSDALYQLNRETGAATRIGAILNFGVSESNPRGLASNEYNLFMVGATTQAGNNGPLYTLDIEAGTANLVGYTGVSSPEGLAFHQGVLYMISGSQLYTVNITSGLATQITTTPGFGANILSARGLLSNGTNLYMADSGRLTTLNPTTGQALFAAATTANITGIAIAMSESVLYTSDVANFAENDTTDQVPIDRLGNVETWAQTGTTVRLPVEKISPIVETSGSISTESSLYALGDTSNRLIRINTQTGAATPLGTSGFGYNELNPRSAVVHNGHLYMIGNSNGRLARIDPMTGLSTLIGPPELGVFESLPRHLVSHNGSLYAIGFGINRLIRIDVTDSNIPAGIALGISGLGINEFNPRGLVSHNGSLYLVGASTDRLVRLNTSTGLGTLLGPSGFGLNEHFPTALASHNGELYVVGISLNTLIRLNTTTGIGTAIGPAGFGLSLSGSEYLVSHNNELYISDTTNNRAVSRLNATTGIATEISTPGFGINESRIRGLISIPVTTTTTITTTTDYVITEEILPPEIARSNELITGGSISGSTLTLNRSSGDITIPGLPSGSGSGGGSWSANHLSNTITSGANRNDPILSASGTAAERNIPELSSAQEIKIFAAVAFSGGEVDGQVGRGVTGLYFRSEITLLGPEHSFVLIPITGIGVIDMLVSINLSSNRVILRSRPVSNFIDGSSGAAGIYGIYTR